MRIAAIEQQRQSLLERNEPLVDGGLGEAGPYDGSCTVADAASVSKAPLPARFLYLMVRAFRPSTILELGTSVGVSTAYLASAHQAAEIGGRILTIEASPYRLRIARELHQALGISGVEYRPGLFADALDSALVDLGKADMIFLDGHHQRGPTLAYVDAICRNAPAGAMIIFDDIRWSKGMRQAWSQIQRDRRFAITVDLGVMGVGVIGQAGGERQFRSRRMYSVLRA